jgi:2-methylcitrate dehydratase PrpD
VLQPLGDPARRAEGIPLLVEKFERSVTKRFARKQAESIIRLCLEHDRLLAMPVPAFTDMLSI